MNLQRLLTWPRHGVSYREYVRLRRLPRDRPARTRFYDRELLIADPIDFLSGVDQIFRCGVYDFAGSDPAPRIIDCGANIGLSCIAFKRRWPAARILACEPDPQLFAALRANMAAFGYDDLELRQAAVWTQNSVMPFRRSGSLGGRLAQAAAGQHNPAGAGAPPAGQREAELRVATVRLRDLLDAPIDMLKIDIEGAETAVLEDCADRLGLVARLVVEYHSPAGEPQLLHRLLAALHGAGMRVYLRAEYGPARPLCERPARDGFDLQLVIAALREPEP